MRARPLLAASLFATSCSAAKAPVDVAALKPSVLLITVDTLRADRVGCYGDAQARTPSMDALARAGTLFERAFSPVPLTLPSHASILTGLLPPAHGVRGNGSFALPAGPVTLAEALGARGLATAAFIGGFPLDHRFGLGRGFGHYDDALARAGGVHFSFAERRGDEVASAAVGWLGSHAGPVFVWAHFFDPHSPYDPPEPFRSGGDLYRGEVAAADSAAGVLLKAWDARPGPSFVALVSDHGEAFGEHREESHSLFVYDATLHVPLLLRGPGIAAGRRVTTPAVGIQDLAATLLAHVPGSGPTLPGRDLLQASLSETPLYAETLAPRLDFGWSDLRAWRNGRYKYIRAPRPELYDLAADPGETRDLAASDPGTASRLDAELAAALVPLHENESRREADPETAERLRALGYVQGPGGQGSGADPKDRVDVALAIARASGPFKDQAAAARAYAAIAALDPGNPLVNMRLADALLRSGQAAEAIGYFEKVVAAHPRSADPFVGLAAANATTGKLEPARRALVAGLEVDPRNGQLHYNLGELARTAGDVAAARRSYTAALEDPVTHDRAKARLGELK
jgi:arylsulfatase A-like enzyme